ncbi:GatB/YqeY domain-containing protein [Paenibacillus alvei]|uniref:GatB/YqeY domain-containing protein n=1 Tax=Paenibacillus alvei TaxID=44250 RepID=UPI000289B874|nr:GatB/YqeY domain-containing protein [Paenibacillus alvei]EJW13922.1 hypothetical protein PAV_141p00280 [Paenibacillus alvei DSM 29]MCY9545282.1 GatB/YqeY domain-containing protein [Paenibacillus alvei]MCY9707714.1 GatB/YqeY domain-containing protein [Paenibacillus alvei]MEC0082773.1 GatB/YqeY domain-containing protein [Paenibacillus alvei]
MRNKDKVTLTTVRMVIDRVQKKEKEMLRELSEEEVMQVLQTFKKQTDEEMDAFKSVNNHEKVAELLVSKKFVESFLPQQMSEIEIRNLVINAIESMYSVGRTPNKGSVMKEVMPLVKGKADNKLVNQIVTNLLQS